MYTLIAADIICSTDVLLTTMQTTAGITWHIYKANVTARFTGKLSKEGLSEVEIKVQALAPAAGLAAFDYTTA